MKTRISTNITWLRYIFGPLALVVVYDIAQSLVRSFDITFRIQIELIALAALTILYYYFRERKDVYYDSNFLYVYYKMKETTISLSKVRKVRISVAKINTDPTWKIHYWDNDDTKQNVRIFYNRSKKEDFKLFLNYIREINPEVKIKDKYKYLNYDRQDL